MRTLTILPRGFGELSGSPFSVKSWCMLERTGEPYRIKRSLDPRKTPKGKFPVLEEDGKVIADSANIRAHLEQKVGIDFDEGLSAHDRAVSRMVIRTLEENTYFAILSNRWQSDAHWPTTRDEFFRGLPPIIGPWIISKVRKAVIAQLIGQGMGRHSPEEQTLRVQQDLDALAELLGDKAFLFGDAPTAADFTAVPMLRSLSSFPIRNPMADIVSKSPVLSAYIERGKEAFYPDPDAGRA